MALVGLLSALVLNASALASEEGIRAQWLGVAGLAISDSETTILIDPVFTKPAIHHWIFNSSFRSDPERVRQGLDQAGIRRAQAILISHEHFDHSVDAATLSSLTGASVYGGPSLRRMLEADRISKSSFGELTDGVPVKVGRFKVIPYRREHPPIFHIESLKFLPGEIRESFGFRFYDYREGETWGYRIEHPAGTWVVDQSSHLYPGNRNQTVRPDVYFVGIANKVSLEDLVDGNIIPVGAPRVIPLHFDFFLLQGRFFEDLRMPGMEIKAIENRLGERAPGIRFIVPKRNEVIRLTAERK